MICDHFYLYVVNRAEPPVYGTPHSCLTDSVNFVESELTVPDLYYINHHFLPKTNSVHFSKVYT